MLRKEKDLVALYLTSSCRQTNQHHNVARLLEAYTQDLGEILNEIRNLRVTVDEVCNIIQAVHL